MAANKHTNKLKIQNYAYEISESGQLVQATQDGNYFEIPNESYFGNNGEYPLIEAMDIDWRPYEINGTPVVTTHDVLNSISQNIERLDYLDDAYTYTMDIIEENEEITAQALTNLDTRVLNIENVDLPDLDYRVETLETTYVSHEFLSRIGYVNSPMSYNSYGYAKLGRNTNITISGRVYPIGMDSNGRLGVEIPYQPGDNTITNIDLSKEGSGNYVKEIKLSHVDNNPILSYTLTVSYSTLPTLSVEGKNTGTAPDGKVIDSITVNGHKITYSYVSIPTYSYAAKNYVSYGYSGLNYVSYGYAKNTYVPYSYAGLNYASYGYTYAYVASAYADVMMSVDELENRIDNISNDYLNTVEGNGTNGYVIGRLGKNGHKVVYGYVAVPTYEYLRNKSYVYGTGYVTQQYLAEKSYIYHINNAPNTGYVIGKIGQDGQNLSYAYVAVPTYEYLRNESYVYGTGYVTQQYLADKSYVHGAGYVTQKYLADKSYIYHINDAPTTGYVIGKIGQNGQNLTYAYVAVPTYEYLKTTGYLISSSLDNYVTKPNAIQNVHLSVDESTYVMTLSYTIANDPDTIKTNTFNFPLESVVVNGYYNSGYVHLELTNGNYVKFSVSDLVNGLVSTDDLNNAGYLTSYTYTTAASGSSTTSGYKLDFSDKTYSKTGLTNSTGFNVTIPKAGTDYGVVKVGEGDNLVGINASGQLTYSQPDVSNFITIDDIPDIPDIVLSNDGTANGTNRVTNIYVDSSNKHKIHIAYAVDIDSDTDSYINKFTTSATDNSGFKVSYDYNTKTGSSFTISKAGVGTYGVVKAYQVSTISANTLKAYNGKNYPVSMTANGYAYVAVPWTDTNDNTYTYVQHDTNTRTTNQYVSGVTVTKSESGNKITYTVHASYETLPTIPDLSTLSYLKSYSYTNSVTKGTNANGFELDFNQVSYNVSGNVTSKTNAFNILIPGANGTSYGLVKSGSGAGKATITNGIITYTDTNDNDNTISYVTHSGNGTGNFINGIIVTNTGTNPVTYTITYSYGTALTSALSTYKDIYSVDLDETWDSAKNKVKIAEGKIISYTNGSTETIAAYNGADIYVSVMNETSYGVAKLGYANTLTIGNEVYGVGMTSDGKLAVNVPSAEQVQVTYTYVNGGTGSAASGKYVSSVEVSSNTNGNIITYTVTASYNDLPSFANSDTYTYLTTTANGDYSTHPGRYIKDIYLSISGTNPVSYNMHIAYADLETTTGGGDGGDNFQYPDYDSSSSFFKISTGHGDILADHDLYIPTMNGGTGGSYGVAKAYHTRYINEIPVALQNPDYSDPNRNYGVSIDNNGKLFVNVPWIGGSLNLTQNGPSGTVVSDIQLSGSNLVITYDTVATGQTITALQNAIDNFGARLDNITGYVEVGNGRAIHWDNTAPYPHAYVDLTGFSVGGPSASIQSMSFANSNNGSLLTVNDGTSHTATLPVMSNTSYGVAQANVIEWHDNFKESLFELQTVDPRNDPSTKKNYKVNIAKHEFDNESGTIDKPEDTGYLFVSIPVSDFGGGSGSGGASITYFGGRQVTSGTSNAYYLAIKENTTYFVSYIPRTSSSTYGLIKVKSSYSNTAPNVASSGIYYPLQISNDGIGVVRVPGSTGGGGTDSQAVHWENNGTGVSGVGPIQNIQVVTSPGTDINTLYIVL